MEKEQEFKKCFICGSKTKIIRPIKIIPSYGERICLNKECETNKKNDD